MNPKKVIIDVQGGIGNQLFMYFAALHWAQANNVELVVNVGTVGTFGIHHGADLDEFDLNCEVVRSAPSIFGVLLYRIKRRISKSKFGIILDKVFEFRTFYTSEVGYDEKLETRKRLNKIEGYFQTYKYFDAIPDTGLKNLRLRKVSTWYEETKRELQNTPYVAVHVRRGDFKNFSKQVGLLSKDYYATAIDELDRILGKNLPIIVFSDEPELAKLVLARHAPRVSKWISQPHDTSPIESLLLMSEADAIIIANSTYSWWAAKLGKPKPVIGPTQWFRSGKPPAMLYPPDWHLIPSSWET